MVPMPYIDRAGSRSQNLTHHHGTGQFPMFALQRQQLITDRIKAHGRVAVADLARELDTSHETIRRDLAALEEAGDLRRVHGGAIDMARVGGPEPPMAVRASLCTDEKKRIAWAALAHVPDTGTILLESASTSLFLAEMLPDGARTTIVTNGLDIAHGLAIRGFDVVMLGGRVRNRSLATLDDWVHPALEGLHADVAFLGTLGFTTHAGLTAPDLPDAAVKRRCLGIADRNLLLAESAKFGVVALCRYADLSDFDLLITDTDLSEAAVEDIRSMGIEIIMA